MDRAVKQWWIYALLGALLLIGGGVITLNPIGSFVIFAQFLAFYFLITGVLELLFAVGNRHLEAWGWRLFIGIFHIVMGLYLLKTPGAPELFLIFMFAFWLMLYGATLGSFGLELRSVGGYEWLIWVVVGGLTLFSAFYILFGNPTAGILFFSMMMGINSMILGLFTLYGSFRLKRLGELEV